MVWKVIFTCLFLVFHLVQGVPFFKNHYDSEHEILGLLEDSQFGYFQDPKPLKKVQPAPCAFTREGCCNDGETRALGPQRQGCDVLLCTDMYVQSCWDKFDSGTLNCNSKFDRDGCKFSCAQCKAQSPPITECLRRRPAHGCCWDGKVALEPNGADCMKCEDVYKNACLIFKDISGGCRSGSWGIRRFMLGYCPETCGFCSMAANGPKA
ncbi:papilin [Nematostella vectensis]|uniref:papilin n=1 Tax=Nematostella vectensis TaxID=45351 RepID=UPI0020778558|nr:papilin [Nematostella vectensis]